MMGMRDAISTEVIGRPVQAGMEFVASEVACRARKATGCVKRNAATDN